MPTDFRLLCWLVPVVVLISGCGPRRAAPVDVSLARQALIQTLDTWKESGTIDQLKSQSPPIIVQESLWTAQNQLIDYRLVDDGRREDANWYCEVELTLKSPNNSKETKRKITYVVGTDPVITVFHAIL